MPRIQVSPGVNVTETDLTTIVPQIASTAGGFVGSFQWGPIDEIFVLDTENNLVRTFGTPTNVNFQDFFQAANFLSYGNNLQTVRVAPTTAYNNTGGTGSTGATPANSQYVQIKSYDHYLDLTDTDDDGIPTLPGSFGLSGPYPFVAKYPGPLGKSLRIHVWGTTAAGGEGIGASGNVYAGFDTWNTYGSGTTYVKGDLASLFDRAPSTSQWAINIGATSASDEIHIVVVDKDGLWTGTPGEVLETFEGVSKAQNAKNFDGTSNYYVNVINNSSPYIWVTKHPDAVCTSSGTLSWGSELTSSNGSFKNLSSAANGGAGITGAAVFTFTELNTGSTYWCGSRADINSAFNKHFADPTKLDVSLLISPTTSYGSVMTGTELATVQSNLIDIAENRLDCVAFLSPPASAVVERLPDDEKLDRVLTYRNTTLNRSSSYAVLDSGWKYQYDRYNDLYRYVPLNSDVAGLCVRTDAVADPWFSPAGFNRGQIRGVVKLAYNPGQTHRDLLYPKNVNPIVAFPGEGTVLYGDKTLQTKPSAFDRINVRRLFIVLEKAISTAAKFSLFEFNDAFTRSQFKSIVEPFLREVQSRRGITDFKVVCDTSNNTAEVIDSNRFVADIYVKPARSINYIQLNFVAVRSGVSFEEVGG